MKQSKETSDMSDNDTRPGGVVVPLYTLSASGRDSPTVGDKGSYQLSGRLLTYSEKEFFVGSGRSREKMPLDTRLIALSTTALWKRWEDGQIAETIAAVDGRLPARDQLGYLDRSQWQPGPGGAPADVWQNSREVRLLRETDYVEFVFCTSTSGGRSAVDDLTRSVANARVLRPNQYPVVALAWEVMSTAYGPRSKPCLRIVAWWKPDETPALAPTDDPPAA
jgi:hypothetical protein